MSNAIWTDLLAQTKAVHSASPALQSFCNFPTDLKAQAVAPYHIHASDLFQGDTALNTQHYGALHGAFVNAAPLAKWRETYKDTDIGQDFMDRFGCYCLIGEGGAYASAQMLAYLVYMPPHLHYPWHDHPAEEIYFVVAGEAEFHRHAEPSQTLCAGDTSFHASSQPHAMTTHDHPVLALVLWRNGFDTGPKLTT